MTAPIHVDANGIARKYTSGEMAQRAIDALIGQGPQAVRDECDRRISATYRTKDGRDMRSSLYVWVASVALTSASARDEFDVQCASMVPALNAWEGRMLLARDAAILDKTPLDKVVWPAEPEGAADFIALCDQG